MGLALVLQTLLVGVAVGGLLHIAFTWQDGWSIGVTVAIMLASGVVADAPLRERRRGRTARAADRQEIASAVQRLCVLADLEPPAIAIERDGLPLSWTVHRPGGTPTVHVTTGLLDRLHPAETEAVLAHELAHIAHRDAWVMTVVAGPGIYVLRGLRDLWEDRHDDFRAYFGVVLFGAFLAPPAVVLALLGRLISRTRELAADEAAARLTGSPARLAAALVSLSQELAGSQRKDLRVAAARDPFNIVPARRREPRFIGRLWATHPRLRARIARLDRLECSLQG